MKAQLRKEMKGRLSAMSPETAAAKSRQACNSLVSAEEFRQAGTVMVYLPIPGEVDTTAIVLAAWQDGKTVLAPRVSRQQWHMLPIEIRSLDSGLAVGSYGIREPQGGEPCPLRLIDLILVPALAYDRSGRRLGRGGGFYDRFLAEPGLRACTCGLGFAEQVLDRLPTQDHDVPVRMLVTDQEVLRF